MKISKIFKIIGGIVAVAGVIAAIYLAIQRLTDKKEPEYFNDDDFFECDNDLEIIEAGKGRRKRRRSSRRRAEKRGKFPKEKVKCESIQIINAEKAVRCAAFLFANHGAATRRERQATI